CDRTRSQTPSGRTPNQHRMRVYEYMMINEGWWAWSTIVLTVVLVIGRSEPAPGRTAEGKERAGKNIPISNDGDVGNRFLGPGGATVHSPGRYPPLGPKRAGTEGFAVGRTFLSDQDGQECPSHGAIDPAGPGPDQITGTHSTPIPASAAPAARAAANSEEDIDEREPVAVPQPSAKALAYYQSGMWLWGLNLVWAFAVYGLLAFSGFSARLRGLAQRLGRLWFFTVGLYVVLFLAIVFLIDLPLDYYEGFVRQHAYGMSNQTLGKWLGDSLKGLGVEMAAGFLFAWVPFLLLAKAPRRWWLYTAILSLPFLLFTVLVKPIWIDPLFNDFGPLKNKALEQSILAEASRAGIEGSRVFEVNMRVDTNAVNAYVTGLFGTKRIVLWDTLIDRLNEKELLFVMAHEMGHYVLGHVMRSILLSVFLTLAGLYFVHRAGRWLIDRFPHRLGFASLADVAAMPLILLLLQVSSLVLEPVAMFYSRNQEHAADRFALDLTRTNHSGATAFVKLQEENLGNPRPGIIYTIFRASHPSIGERIDFCNEYRPGQGSKAEK
ncbi:MAG: M48 family metallopeptidase, partial [Isosphaeraceae bacterium]